MPSASLEELITLFWSASNNLFTQLFRSASQSYPACRKLRTLRTITLWLNLLYVGYLSVVCSSAKPVDNLRSTTLLRSIVVVML